MKSLQQDVHQAKKENEVIETHQATLENEKSSLSHVVEVANIARDEEIAWATSFESKQTKLVNAMKVEVEGQLNQALFELLNAMA